MTIIKRSKMSRARGSHTHGGGAMKKRRGAGNRGGRGNAGSGKKGDCKTDRYKKIKNYFGTKGFNSHSRTKVKVLNLSDLDFLAEHLMLENKIKEDKIIKLDLKSQGYTKLMGKGKVKRSYEIIIPSSTQKAIEGIEKLKGKVIIEQSSDKEVQDSKTVQEA